MHAAGGPLASPTQYNALPGLQLRTAGEYTSVDEYAAYLQRYAVRFELEVEQASLSSLERSNGSMLARFDNAATASFEVVVVATGLWSFPALPAWAAAAAVPIAHSRSWRGPQAHPGRLLIVGAGMTGVEIAEECARAGRRVTLSARRPIRLAPQRFLGRDVHDFLGAVEWLPTWLARRHCTEKRTLPPTDLGFSRFLAAGLIDVRSALERLDGNTAWFADGSSAEIDQVIAATGFAHATPFLPASVQRAPAGHVLTRSGESISWPGLFLVGSPCAFGLASEYLRGIARDAPRVADRIAERLAVADR